MSWDTSHDLPDTNAACPVEREPPPDECGAGVARRRRRAGERDRLTDPHDEAVDERVRLIDARDAAADQRERLADEGEQGGADRRQCVPGERRKAQERRGGEATPAPDYQIRSRDASRRAKAAIWASRQLIARSEALLGRGEQDIIDREVVFSARRMRFGI
ncbi:hypothetical protein ACFYWU_17840 [Streptomyces chrestomyceticus]|uniref:hypothetical protein n=1 Tax=Streptomyces chrestomyceticus TaxID=68185 RepID=UPI0036989D34